MKTCSFLFAFAVLATLPAFADVDVNVKIYSGVPIYSTPPAYYRAYEAVDWMSTPVQVVDVEGVPHRMHHWRGQWYDESWRDHRRWLFKRVEYKDRIDQDKRWDNRGGHR